MKRIFHYLSALALGLASSAAVAAEPARPSVQPGDFYCFRGMEASDINYMPAQHSRRPQMRLDKLGNSKFDNSDGHDLREVKTEGDYRILVVLVNFQDIRFSTQWGDYKALIDDMLNGKDFKFQGATGSVNNFFQRVSAGKFNPIFDVAGPVTLSKNEIDYVTSNPDDVLTDENGNPILDSSGKKTPVYPAGRMVEEAVKALENDVDFSQYDSDGDGYVDFIYFFFAGVSATTGGDKVHNIWPHAFTLTSALGAPVEIDGVKVNRYCTSSELGSNKQLAGIGTFCHEFGHVLGLPDFYDTANNDGRPSACFTPGCFSSMDAGYYNNNEHTPPLYSSYEQYSLEWMKPATLSGTGSYTLLPIEARPFAYQVTSKSNPHEYYLLEARGNSYLDRFMLGHGMLVWHIDFNLDIWNSNKPNKDPNHQRVDVVEADNIKTEGTRSGDTFPGAAGICEFTKGVTPAFKDWTGNPLGYDLRQIRSEFDGTISFNANSDSQIAAEAVIAAPTVKVTGATANSIDIEWSALENAKDYYVSVFNADDFNGDLLPYEAYAPGYYFRKLDGVEAKDGIYRTTLSDLPGNMNCGIMLYAANDLNASRQAAPVVVSTVDSSDFAKAATNIRMSTAAEGYVITDWDEVEGADEYELVIATREKGQSTSTSTYDFETSDMPENWSGNGKYDNRKYGVSAPSYALQSPGAYLQSEVFSQPISELTFWACRRYNDKGAEISIFALDKNGVPSLAAVVSDPDNKGEIVKVDMPAESYGFRISYNYSVTDLHLYIDDINVTFTAGHIDTPVADADVEYDGNSANVKGLKENQEYVAYVYPIKEKERGAKSNEYFFKVENLEISGVEGVIDSASSISFATDGLILLPSDSNSSFSIYSIDGTAIALNHKGSFELPSKGIYLISTPGKTLKLIL